MIEYARNPEKTDLNDLAREIHYIADDKKTEWIEDEKVHLVSTINCTGDPYEAMMKVREHFGDRGSILIHHAYQSFKPGEVTPEKCHKIGVELAQNLWGERYQVMVATHLNRSHLHNHLILNPISFIDGKKIDSGFTNYFSLRAASDVVCRKYGLSVIENARGRTPRTIYFDEKAGKPTRYNLMRWAIDEARKVSPTWSDFILHLRDKGFEFDRNEGGKYPKIKPKDGNNGRESIILERIIASLPSTRASWIIITRDFRVIRHALARSKRIIFLITPVRRDSIGYTCPSKITGLCSRSC